MMWNCIQVQWGYIAIAEQADVNQSRGTQVAMMKCLQIWKQYDPSQATYRALLDIVLRLGKGLIKSVST